MLGGKEFPIFQCSFIAGAVKGRSVLRGDKISGAVETLEEKGSAFGFGEILGYAGPDELAGGVGSMHLSVD